jgi:hypothetical protein
VVLADGDQAVLLQRGREECHGRLNVRVFDADATGDGNEAVRQEQ